MVAVATVLTIIGVLILGLCVWLGKGEAKGVVVLGFIAGILVSTTGLAEWFRDILTALIVRA